MYFQDFCRINQINITTLKMSGKIKGFVYHDSQEFHIIINDQLCSQQQLKTLKHELLHIIYGHFDSNLTVKEMEQEIESTINDYEFCFI